MNWKNLTLGQKLGGIFGVTALISATLTYFSISGGATMGQQIRILESSSHKLQLQGELKAELANLRVAQRGIIMYASAHAADKVERNKAAFETSLNRIRSLLAAIRPWCLSRRRFRTSMPSDRLLISMSSFSTGSTNSASRATLQVAKYSVSEVRPCMDGPPAPWRSRLRGECRFPPRSRDRQGAGRRQYVSGFPEMCT
jgi:hypothetical protein